MKRTLWDVAELQRGLAGRLDAFSAAGASVFGNAARRRLELLRTPRCVSENNTPFKKGVGAAGDHAFPLGQPKPKGGPAGGEGLNRRCT